MSTSGADFDTQHIVHSAFVAGPTSAAPVQRTIDPLDALFKPRSVALIGASERPGSVGRTVMTNLLSNPFGGCVFPVNAKRKSVLGVSAFPNVSSLPQPVDLAVVVTPAPTVPEIVQKCAEAGVPSAIVVSAGFKELGPEGVDLERKLLHIAKQHQMRIVGPNCLGVMSPLSGLNATFAKGMARPGGVAFLSQSGALCTGILDWSLRDNVGFSAFVSLGSMLDVNWGDLIDYFGQDPRTSSILLYMETVGDARSFLSAAREVALNKPIIAIKGGRTEEASKAAASHTGSLAGSDLAFDAALQRVGVLRVDRIAELFSMASVLAKQPRPKGPRLTIVTNAGGPGVLATDALVQGGGKLAELSADTKQALDAFLPVHWSHNNPIDILGDADAQRYARALKVAAQDPASDGLLVILTPQDMTDPLETAEHLRPLAQIKDKPVLASWMGGKTVEEAKRILNEASIPTFAYPDTAVRAFNYLWPYSQNLRNIYETPSLVSDDPDHAPARFSATSDLIQVAHSQGRTLLTEEESKRLFAAYGIPTVPTLKASTAEEAVAVATQIGFPVVVKLHSLTITHKTDVAGVQLNLQSAQQVADAVGEIQKSVQENRGDGHFHGVTVQPMMDRAGYEIILGGSLDGQFGPVVLFGAGGQLVEIFRDRAVALPPLNATLARRLMQQTLIYKALQGTRGRPPVDLPALEKTLIGFSNLLIEQPWVKECDINPLLVSPEGVLVLDARVVLHPPGTQLQGLPRPAIRPFPANYIRKDVLKDGTCVRLRPIRLEDEPLMVKFHQTLSEASVHRRYCGLMNLSHRIAHDRLIRVCYNDYDRELAIVAECHDEVSGEESILGVGRLSRGWGQSVAEFAILVSDQWQGRGLGRLMLDQLVRIGRQEQIRRIVGYILPDNFKMQNLCKQAGFSLEKKQDEVRLQLDLK